MRGVGGLGEGVGGGVVKGEEGSQLAYESVRCDETMR